MAWVYEADCPIDWGSVGLFFSPIHKNDAEQYVVYVGGGYEAAEKDFYRYNFQTELWQQLEDCPVSIVNCGMSLSPDKTTILATGLNENVLRFYDIGTTHWTTSPAAPSIGGVAAQIYGTVFADDDTVWCQVRGNPPNAPVKFYKYVISTTTWSSFANSVNLAVSNSWCMSISSDGLRLYAGQLGANYYDIYKYVIATDTYSGLSLGLSRRFIWNSDRNAKLWYYQEGGADLDYYYYDCDAEALSVLIFPKNPDANQLKSGGFYDIIAAVMWARTSNPSVMSYFLVAIPSVTTNPATSVEEETATGKGNITDTGGEDCDKRGICWNTTGNPTVEDDKSEETDPFGTGAFSRPITGLSPGTKYYVKAYAHNSAGYGYGDEESFTTKPNAPSNLVCVVQSSSQIDINWTKGTGATKTMVRRKVGSYPSDVTDGDQAYYGTDNNFNDIGLDPGKHYYYRAWSWVEGSDIWSDDYAEDNAWTLIGVPTVTTDAATGEGAIAATLNGTPDDDGGEVCECGFQWGLDTGYGTITSTESKTKGQTFSQVIGGLAPNTTYHFRAFATNSAGTSFGADRTFTTALIICKAYALAREEL